MDAGSEAQKFQEKFGRPMNIGPDCANTIVVDGIEYRCNRKTGDTHFSNGCMCETKITDPDGTSGRLVRWSTWRRVQPCATGGK